MSVKPGPPEGRIFRDLTSTDCSHTSVAHQASLEGTPQSATISSISDYLDKVSQQLADPKSDIEKTCDFLGMLMAKMTPSCLEDFTHEATCKAMEYVKQSNLERHQAQQPPQVTLLQPPQPPLRFTQQLQPANSTAVHPVAGTTTTHRSSHP